MHRLQWHLEKTIITIAHLRLEHIRLSYQHKHRTRSHIHKYRLYSSPLTETLAMSRLISYYPRTPSTSLLLDNSLCRFLSHSLQSNQNNMSFRNLISEILEKKCVVPSDLGVIQLPTYLEHNDEATVSAT